MAFLKNIWKNNSKHHKLSEELALQNSKELLQDDDVENNDKINDDIIMINNEDDIITFKLKYLGSTIIEKKNYNNNNQISAESVKNIIKVAKVSRKKLQRVQIQISLKGIIVSDLEGNDLFKVSIYRISNCSTDPTHRQVFSFLSTDADDDPNDKRDIDKNATIMECHAFLCSKRKTAETVTLTVAQAFNAAYKQWRVRPKQPQPPQQKKTTSNDLKQQQQQQTVNIEEEKLIDFDDNPYNDDDNDDINNSLLTNDSFLSPQQQQTPKFNDSCNTNKQWVCFDDDFIVNNSLKNSTVFA